MTKMIIFQYIQIICFISISYLSCRTSLFIFLWFSLPSSYVASLISWILCFPYSLVASWERTSTNSEISSWIQKLHVWMSSFTLTLEWWFHWMLNSRLKISVYLLKASICNPHSLFPPTLKDCRIFYLSLVFWYFMVFLKMVFHGVPFSCGADNISPNIYMYVHTDIHTVSPSMPFFMMLTCIHQEVRSLFPLLEPVQTTCASQDVLGLEPTSSFRNTVG